MHKKQFLKRPGLLILSVIILFILQISCVVNENTSAIIINNMSNDSVKNIKIGDKVIMFEIQQGGTFSYYFFSEFEGQLTADGAISVGYSNNWDINRLSVPFSIRNGTYHLRAEGYFYFLDIFKVDGDTYMAMRVEYYESGDGDNEDVQNYIYNEFYTE